MIKQSLVASNLCSALAGCNQMPTAVTPQLKSESLQQLSVSDIDSLINRHGAEFIR